MELLDNIRIQLNPEQVLKRMHLSKEKYLGDIKELVEIANHSIDPKVAYKVSYVNGKNDSGVEIDSIRFTSRVLRVNLDRIERVFPYVMTIGKDLEDTAASLGDLLKQFYLDTMGNIALDHVGEYFEDHLRRKYRLDKISEMNPGSLEDWPIAEQKPLFSLLGNVEELTGVKLSGSLMMIPRKSVSGIYFPTEVTFYSCQLCPRKKCEERQAPYDKTLAKKYQTT